METPVTENKAKELFDLYNQVKGLLGNLRGKGNVDVERDLEIAMNSELTLEQKLLQVREILKIVFNMIHGDGRSSDYR
jgi:hypothetical protein